MAADGGTVTSQTWVVFLGTCPASQHPTLCGTAHEKRLRQTRARTSCMPPVATGADSGTEYGAPASPGCTQVGHASCSGRVQGLPRNLHVTPIPDHQRLRSRQNVRPLLASSTSPTCAAPPAGINLKLSTPRRAGFIAITSNIFPIAVSVTGFSQRHLPISRSPVERDSHRRRRFGAPLPPRQLLPPRHAPRRRDPASRASRSHRVSPISRRPAAMRHRFENLRLRHRGRRRLGRRSTVTDPGRTELLNSYRLGRFPIAFNVQALTGDQSGRRFAGDRRQCWTAAMPSISGSAPKAASDLSSHWSVTPTSGSGAPLRRRLFSQTLV